MNRRDGKKQAQKCKNAKAQKCKSLKHTSSYNPTNQPPKQPYTVVMSAMPHPGPPRCLLACPHKRSSAYPRHTHQHCLFACLPACLQPACSSRAAPGACSSLPACSSLLACLQQQQPTCQPAACRPASKVSSCTRRHCSTPASSPPFPSPPRPLLPPPAALPYPALTCKLSSCPRRHCTAPASSAAAKPPSVSQSSCRQALWMSSGWRWCR